MGELQAPGDRGVALIAEGRILWLRDKTLMVNRWDFGGCFPNNTDTEDDTDIRCLRPVKDVTSVSCQGHDLKVR